MARHEWQGTNGTGRIAQLDCETWVEINNNAPKPEYQ
jgi:hypothetical protein